MSAAGGDLRLAARGIGWNYLGSGAVLAGQVLYTALTARLVSPEGFGAYAAAQALVALVGYFGLATLGNAVIRHPRQGREVAGTAFVMTLGAGVAVSTIVLLGASLWGRMWGVPGSEGVTRAFALVLLLSALGYVPLAVLRKALAYRTAALVEALSQLGGMAVGAALAFHFRSPVALVMGQAAASGLTAAGAIVATRRKLTLTFSTREARSLLAFSGHVSGQSLLYYGLYTAPSLLVSRMFGAAALGGYSRANVMVTLPVTHLWVGVTKALYPLVARAWSDRRRLQELIESTLATTVGLTWPIFAAVAGAAPIVVRIVLGGRWSDVAPLLPPMLVFGAVNLAFVVAGNPLEVLGFQRIIWSVQMLWLILLASGLAAGALLHVSVEALLWIVAAVQIAVHVVKLKVTARLSLIRFGYVMRTYASALAVSGVFFTVTAAVERVTSNAAPAGRAAAVAVAALLLCSLTAVLAPRTPLGRVVRIGVGFCCERLRLERQPAAFTEPGHAGSDR